MSVGDMMIHLALFVLVQALVYLILSKSSNVFAKKKSIGRSLSLKPARTSSIRQMFSILGDLPFTTEPSPSSRGQQFVIEDDLMAANM